MKQKLLLHVCCAPCAVKPIIELQDRFDVVLYFYGPNIHPREEYDKRIGSASKLAEELKVVFIKAEYDTTKWFELAKGLESEKEGGNRCKICYKMRLEKTASYAKDNGFNCFGCTLTLSPYKSADIINTIGNSVAEEYNISFLEEDFKKRDGFKQSCELSKKFNLYRQKYCGCEYSVSRGVLR